MEVCLGEVRPECVGDVNFGVAELPEEEVREAEFARGADEEIGVGEIAGVEMGGDGVAVDLVWRKGAVGNPGGDGANGVRDFAARAVIEGQDDLEAGAVAAGLDGLFEAGEAGGGEFFDVADGAQSDIAVEDFLGAFLQKAFEQEHEALDFVFWAFPIFRRKGVESEEFHPGIGSRLESLAHGFGALFMAGEAREASLACPTTVPIHDDGNMAWDGGMGGRFVQGGQSRIVWERAGPTLTKEILVFKASAMRSR